MTGGESGAVKWYAAQNYRVSSGDPLTPNYGFLDVNSAVPAQNPWGTNTDQTHEQTYTLIHVDGDTMTFSTYMFRYDGRSDQMITAPYLYDSLILRRGDAARGDLAATADRYRTVFPLRGMQMCRKIHGMREQSTPYRPTACWMPALEPF